MLGVTQTQALVLLFIVLPLPVAGAVIAFVAWRSSSDPPPIRTSTILANGDPATAEVLSVKALGGFFDLRPMVRLSLRVTGGVDEAPFVLEVVQSLPRGAAWEIHPGDLLDIRMTADRSAGAVAWGAPPGAA